MYQILKKLFIVFLCLSLLSSFAFASAAEPTPSVVVQWNKKLGSSHKSGSFNIDGASPSSSESGTGIVSFTSGSVSVDNSASSTTVFQLSPVSANFSASTTSKGFSVSSSVSDGVATISVVSSANRDSNLCGINFSGSGVTITQSSFSASGYSFTSGGGSVNPPVDEYAGTGSMFGWTGTTLFTLRFVEGQHWYTLGTGSDRVGHLDVVVATTEAEMPGYYARTSMLASLTYQKWKWAIDQQTGLPKFSVMQEQQGTWADMIYRTSVYNYFWGSKLWNNDVSGSWYGSISTDFSYLNFRVNQIFDVLANDEDLSIKDATTPEREWVKGYFSGSGDKADSDKYNSLNSDGQALKDFLTPSESASMSDALSAVESQGYSFWSENVYQDINQGSSTASVGLGDDVPWEEQINDLYSEHVALIGGAFDD